MKVRRGIILQGIFLLVLGYLGYAVSRESFGKLFLLYTVAFLLFLVLLQNVRDLNYLIRYSLLLRIVLLFSVPALSNDFYRFIWDGRMLLHGWNPYLVLPEEFAGTSLLETVGKDAQQLLEGQGALSPGNYTTYPPLNQLFFYISVRFFPENIPGSIVIMRLLLIAAEAGTLFFGRKILQQLRLPESNILIYALNPMVILEVTGNLHFEGILLFFLVLALYFLLVQRHRWSSLWLTLSISVKLIPLLFLPLFLKKTGQRTLFVYSMIVLSGTVLLFLPFYHPDLVSNFFSSIDLYFRKFEFNASIYYLVRWAGYEIYGWNIIQKAGPLLGTLVFIILLLRSVLARNQYNRILMESLLLASTVYYFLATTVHPWYLCLPLLLSTFTRYRYMVVWSWLVFLSYAAYSNPGYKENLWLISIEYGIVYGFLILERWGIISFDSVSEEKNWQNRR